MTFVAIPRRSETIRAHKEHGGRVAAILPIHYPRALFRAFDILPVEVWGPPRADATRAAAHIQPYICSIVRNALAFLSSGGLDVADIIVVPHACDSLQGFASILIDFVQPQPPVLPIYLPRGNRASDAAFLAAEFRALHQQLATITGRAPSADELMECIQREEDADARLAELHQQRRHLPLAQIEFYRLIRAREYLPAESFSDLARAALAQTNVGIKSEGVPIILSGIVPEPMAMLDALARLGGSIVADDFACCGRRLYPAGKSADAFERMAEQILNAPPDPTRGAAIETRLEHLLRLAKSSHARGIVFYSVKFCEPELFYLPALCRGLQQAGMPSLAVEVDIGDSLSHQIVTRLEAFLEMIA